MPKITDKVLEGRALTQWIKNAKHRLETDLRDCRLRQTIAPTTIKYEVGDRVRYGSYNWSGVLEILDDGKILKLFSVIFYTKTQHDGSGWKIHYVNWHEIAPYRENENDIERYTQDDDIFFQYSQRDVRSLLGYFFSRYPIDLEPDYQRGNVWTLEQKVKLIDSVFRNVDIGKFVIIKREWGKNPNQPASPNLTEMLDGKQRLTALLEYYTGQFKYKGKYFHELNAWDRNHFKNYRVSIADINPITDEQKYRYFLKLNTTGTPVDPDHMAKVAGMLMKETENDGR